MKTILQSLLGIALCIGGIYVMYLYINSIDTNGNILLLIASIVVVIAGMIILVWAGKSDTIILNRTSKAEKEIVTETTPAITGIKDEGLSNKIEENNKLLEDWRKTNETKERLKMLEMSATANDK